MFFFAILIQLMSKKIRQDSLVQPIPFTKFKRCRILYVPIDSPTKFIQKNIKKKSLSGKITPFGHLYLLKKSVVLYQCIGAPLAVLALERLITPKVEEIIILGFCGALDPDSNILDALCIKKAFSEEGTSRHYFPRKRLFYPSSELTKSVKTLLKQKELPFRLGTLVSTDAPYRETKEWLQQKKKWRLTLLTWRHPQSLP